MGDPTGYLDEGKGLPWITMDCWILANLVHQVDQRIWLLARQERHTRRCAKTCTWNLQIKAASTPLEQNCTDREGARI